MKRIWVIDVEFSDRDGGKLPTFEQLKSILSHSTAAETFAAATGCEVRLTAELPGGFAANGADYNEGGDA